MHGFADEADPCGGYDALRERYRPDEIRFLLLGESPPDRLDRKPRFFYCPEFRSPDALYGAVIDALYDEPSDVQNKLKYLDRLKQDGWWLLDAVEVPINHLPTESAKRAAIRAAGPSLVTRLLDERVRPTEGVVVCLARVFDELADQLREAGIPVLHDQPLPFPNWPSHRVEFVEGLRKIAGLI